MTEAKQKEKLQKINSEALLYLLPKLVHHS
jgi:hypothetical protein